MRRRHVPRSAPQNGPASTRERSRTRMPSSARGHSCGDQGRRRRPRCSDSVPDRGTEGSKSAGALELPKSAATSPRVAFSSPAAESLLDRRRIEAPVRLRGNDAAAHDDGLDVAALPACSSTSSGAGRRGPTPGEPRLTEQHGVAGERGRDGDRVVERAATGRGRSHRDTSRLERVARSPAEVETPQRRISARKSSSPPRWSCRAERDPTPRPRMRSTGAIPSSRRLSSGCDTPSRRRGEPPRS